MTNKPLNPEGGQNLQESLAPKERDFNKIFDEIHNPVNIERRFQELSESALRQLEGLDDSQKVVVDNFPGEGNAYTVAELKHLIATMRDKDNPLTSGYDLPIVVISTNPEEYFKETQEQTERSKQFALKQIEPYSDDQLLTYVHPNRYISFETGKADYYQKTAKELRDWINSMDYEDADQILSHMGGIKIVSDDPNISMDELEQRTIENEKVHQALIQDVIDKINFDIDLCQRIRTEIKDLPDDAIISYPLRDGSQSPEFSVRMLKARLGLSKNKE
jgi:hypothetical protein